MSRGVSSGKQGKCWILQYRHGFYYNGVKQSMILSRKQDVAYGCVGRLLGGYQLLLILSIRRLGILSKREYSFAVDAWSRSSGSIRVCSRRNFNCP